MDADGRGGFGSSLIFEEMGLRYLGPIDGHDLPLLDQFAGIRQDLRPPDRDSRADEKGQRLRCRASNSRKNSTAPGLTMFRRALRPRRNPAPPRISRMFSARRWSSFARKTTPSSGITAAMPSGTGLKPLEKAMPQRYYDVGIAEEHAVLFAAGMATMGFHPVVRHLLHVPATRLRLHHP